MPVDWIVFIAALTVGLISGYTTRVLTRGVHGQVMLDHQPLWRAAAGAFGFFALVAALIWGFVHLTWYWVIAAFLGVSLFVVPLAFGRRLPFFSFWISVQPLLDVACVGLSAYLWLEFN